MSEYNLDNLPRELAMLQSKLPRFMHKLGTYEGCSLVQEMTDMANVEGLDTLFGKADSELGSFMSNYIQENYDDVSRTDLVNNLIEAMLVEFPVVKPEEVCL